MAGAIEIKDHNSNVRLSLNAFGAAFIDTINPISVQGTVTTVPGISSSVTGVYAFTVLDAPGVVAANNFVSLFNPIGSGKNLVLFGGSISSYIAGGGSTTKNSMQVQRVTAASAGTLQATSAIAKFVSTYANPVAEVRTGNPTVTLGANFIAAPPPINPNTNNYVYEIEPPPGVGPFLIVPGEGIVVRTAVGDTDQNWDINIVWGEV